MFHNQFVEKKFPGTFQFFFQWEGIVVLLMNLREDESSVLVCFGSMCDSDKNLIKPILVLEKNWNLPHISLL